MERIHFKNSLVKVWLGSDYGIRLKLNKFVFFFGKKYNCTVIFTRKNIVKIGVWSEIPHRLIFNWLQKRERFPIPPNIFYVFSKIIKKLFCNFKVGVKLMLQLPYYNIKLLSLSVYTWHRFKKNRTPDHIKTKSIHALHSQVHSISKIVHRAHDEEVIFAHTNITMFSFLYIMELATHARLHARFAK